MRFHALLAGVALAVALTAAGGGTAWAGSLPGGGGDDGDDHHHGGRCPAPTAEPATLAGLGSLLSVPRPGAPGPVPPLPTSGAAEHPDRDPFYRAPDGFAACAPGTVLRSRVVNVIGATSLTGEVPAHQLLFRSTDARGKPIAAVTTILQPRMPAPGPRRLVSYQVAEDSLTTGCAPSYTLRTNSGLPAPIEGPWIATALANGWTLSIPDHQGPRSEFAVGPLEGRVTLDSIRAVIGFGPAGLDGDRTRVGLMGYSGGSVPTLWADALAEAYAPELNLVGAAAGGVIADSGGLTRANPGPPFFGATFALSVALDRTYPDFDLDSLLTDQGRELADRLGRDANGCFGLITAAPLADVRTHTRYPDVESFLAVPRVAKAFAATNLVAGPRLTLPTVIVHGVQDELIPVAQSDALVSAQCRAGATVDYLRVPGEHVSTLAPYLERASTFLRDRFAGRPADGHCG
jgi:hypothetical protein